MTILLCHVDSERALIGVDSAVEGDQAEYSKLHVHALQCTVVAGRGHLDYIRHVFGWLSSHPCAIDQVPDVMPQALAWIHQAAPLAMPQVDLGARQEWIVAGWSRQSGGPVAFRFVTDQGVYSWRSVGMVVAPDPGGRVLSLDSPEAMYSAAGELMAAWGDRPGFGGRFMVAEVTGFKRPGVRVQDMGMLGAPHVYG